MAVSLGKRKRVQPQELAGVQEPLGSDDEVDQQALQDIFRKHFEAKYKPLPVTKLERKDEEVGEVESSDMDDEEDEWDGFSEEQQNEVEVVEHVDTKRSQEEMDKRELRAFLSSKVPIKKKLELPKRPLVLKAKGDDDEDSAMNLKNDLALQRLLTESHILSKDKSGGLKPTGKSRHKALDLRFQALGSKDSIFAQGRAPMRVQKGMLKKKNEREQKRRSDAKEGNVILEREVKEKKSARKRERGVGAPAVGNFKRGLLTLSREDVRDIQGNNRSGFKKRR